VSSRAFYSARTNNKASVQQAQAFLDEFFIKLKKNGWYLRLDRDKNKDALYELDLTSAEIENFILNLKPQDYYSGPKYDTKPYRRSENPGPLWAFGTMVEDTEVYVKLRLGAFEDKAVCVSFHPSSPALDYPLR
jgi:hypothetical protein